MIYLIRHGESEANLRKVFAGQKDDSLLTDEGRSQARATAQKIKKEGLKINGSSGNVMGKVPTFHNGIKYLI